MKPFTAWTAVYNIFRAYNMTTIFGNPGSTEQTLLEDFPSDFQYILGLQEASVVGMADGYAQATRNPVACVLHSAAGVGNGMANIITAFLNKSPLVIVAGQQHRKMLAGDPFLTNREATLLPQPWVKFSYQPLTAEEVPDVFVRAIAMAMQPPMGPVFVSVPLDLWQEEIPETRVLRTVSTTFGPDPARLADFASRIAKAKRPVLVYGEEVDQSQGWDAGVRLAELLQVPVFQAPLSGRAVFPATNKLYHKSLPIAQGPIGEALEGFDLAVVIGAEVFRYYPWSPGPVLQNGTHLLQITNSPHDAGSARLGDSLLSDAKLALEGLYDLLKDQHIAATDTNLTRSTASASATSSTSSATASSSAAASNNGTEYMSALEAFKTIAMLRKPSDILVTETESNVQDLLEVWPIDEPESYFISTSGFLGWGLPAAVGIAMAQTNRTTVAAIGDGAVHYSIQSIWSAVQHKAKLVILVPKNEEYAILKEFAVFEETPGCPGLNLPGLSAKTIAEGYGLRAFYADTPTMLYQAYQDALLVDGPALIEFQINPKVGTLPV